MVLFNYSTKELTAKIVYYGPGLCGKTTNLQFIHQNLPNDVRGKMLSLATKTDRTLFFDFLPIDLGSIRGMKTRVQLYTVPGQVFYNETRRLVLKGADGIVFVADSQQEMMGANIESFRNLEENLKAHGLKLGDMPHVLQFNKRDLPRLSNIEELNTGINKYNAPFYESVATTGIGVQDTLKAIVKLVLLHLTKKYEAPSRPAEASGASSQPAAAAAPAEPPTSVRRSPPPGPPRVAVSAETRAIPLSDFEDPLESAGKPAEPEPVPEARPPAAHVPPPPDFRAQPESEAEPAPDFADDEIEQLMDEVGDAESIGGAGESESAPTERPLAAAASGGDLDAGLSSGEGADGFAGSAGVGAGLQSSAGDASPPLSEPGVVDEIGATIGESDGSTPEKTDDASLYLGERENTGAEIGDASSPDRASLEVDRGFDPEWDKRSTESKAATPEALAVAGQPPPPPPAESEVLLTEVARDSDLFEDPQLEVTRLGPGADREIVVPVIVGEGESARRFKLSVKLFLEPVD